MARRLKCAKAMLCAVLLLIGATIVHADTAYLYTVSGGGQQGILTIAPSTFSFTETTIAGSGDTTAITNISGPAVSEFAWNSEDQTDLGFGGFPGTANACFTYPASNPLSALGASCLPFDPDSFLTTGTFTSEFGDILGVSLSVNIEAITVPHMGNMPPPPGAPESSSLILLTLGMLSVLLAVRRFRPGVGRIC